ncbi:NAD(P)-binding protein [Lentinula raphanica]|nr:NAD(P)-binding protein [Lentinula raphanica]
MAPITNGRLLFKEIPTGYPVPGKTTIYDTSQTIDLETEPLNEGSVLVKTLVLSVDPYLRGKMRAPEKESYTPPFFVDEPLYNFGVGKIIRSSHPSFKPGQHVYGVLDFAEYSIPKDSTKLKVLDEVANLPYSVYVGAAGMPGQTAYYGWKEFARAKKGEVAFVSTGAGPVGSLVIQLAKQDGLKVIASAGSDDKVQFCKDIGADVAFNYKTTDTGEVLKREGPVDVYWDNVGGPTLEAAIENSALHGRIIVCGYASQYNNEEPYGIKTMRTVLSNRLSINGMLVFDLQDKYQEDFFKEIPGKLASGELKYTEDVTRGLDKAGEAIVDVLKGVNRAKKIVLVADE